jgi:hypothetical protein
MILKIFSPKIWRKNGVFVQNARKFCKNWIITLFLRKQQLFGEN